MKAFIDAYFDFYNKNVSEIGEIDPYFYAKIFIEKNTEGRITVLPFNGGPSSENGFNEHVKNFVKNFGKSVQSSGITEENLLEIFHAKFDAVPLCGPIRGATVIQKQQKVDENTERGRPIISTKRDTEIRSKSAPITSYGRRLVKERFNDPLRGKTVGGGSKTRKKRKQTKRKQRRGKKTRRK